MKPESGAVKLLLLAEAIVLAVVLVFGMVNKVRAAGTKQVRYQNVQEKLAAESQGQIFSETEDTSTQEMTETASVLENDSELSVSEPELSDDVKEKLASMTLEEKAAQIFLTTPESLTQNERVNIAGAGTKTAINQYPVGGLIYSEGNYQGRGQMEDLLSNGQQMMHERMNLYLFLAARMDTEEGASVVGISDSYNTGTLVDVFSAKRLDDESAGIDMPLRFPENRTELAQDTAWVMLSAENNAQADQEADMPCALSEECVKTVRAAGYQGIILTDSLSADNIADRYPVGDAAVLAVKAGVDMVYCPENFPDAYRAVLAAVNTGELEEAQIDAAVGRILTRKYQLPEMTAEQTVRERQPEQIQQQENISEEDDNLAE